MGRLEKVVDFGGKYIDYRLGLGGALLMGGAVFGINYYETSGDILGSTTAALKQGAYTFLFGGAVMKSCGYLATKIKNKALALGTSVIVPSLFTLLLTYGIHNLNGTPEPFKSTIPTTSIIPVTLVVGYRKRMNI